VYVEFAGTEKVDGVGVIVLGGDKKMDGTGKIAIKDWLSSLQRKGYTYFNRRSCPGQS
jgi:hypothetical protein